MDLINYWKTEKCIPLVPIRSIENRQSMLISNFPQSKQRNQVSTKRSLEYC